MLDVDVTNKIIIIIKFIWHLKNATLAYKLIKKINFSILFLIEKKNIFNCKDWEKIYNNFPNFS